MRVARCVFLVCCLLVVLRSAKADDVIIGSPLIDGRVPVEDGKLGNDQPITTFDYSGTSFERRSLMDNFAVAIQQAGQAAGLKQAFALNVDAARKEFFDLYPDKPGVDAARTKLANLLAQIDLYYLSLYVSSGMSDAEIRRVAAIDRLTGGPFGHGIQPSAEDAFRRWVDVAREAMGAIPRDPQAGRVNVMTGAPIPDANRSASFIAECTKPAIVCSQSLFVPTPAGYIEGIAAAKDTYAYYVVLRDRAELSLAKHISIFSLPPITVRPPAPPAPPASLLVAHNVVAFDPSVLGSNNFQAARSMGSLLPNGADKWTTYEQVVRMTVQSGKYKTLDCTYGNSKTVYHFWSGTVPPNFPQLVYAVTLGYVIGDAARLGTKPVAECPSDETEAKRLQKTLLDTPDGPNSNAALPEESVLPLSHEWVGAISATKGTYQHWDNLVKPENVERFKAEVDKAIATKQQILECQFSTYGLIRYFFYWYKSAPANVTTLIGLPWGYNGAISHMGTSGRDSCPPTLVEANTAFNKLTQESSKFVKY